jgi:hypothetical protein
MWDAWGRWEIVTTYLGENVIGRRHFGGHSRREKCNIEMDFGTKM